MHQPVCCEGKGNIDKHKNPLRHTLCKLDPHLEDTGDKEDRYSSKQKRVEYAGGGQLCN